MITLFQLLQHVDYVLPYLIMTTANFKEKFIFALCNHGDFGLYKLNDKHDIPDSYTQAIKGEHGSKEDRRTNSHISHVFIITYKAHNYIKLGT